MRKIILFALCAALAAAFLCGCVSINLSPAFNNMASGGVVGKGDFASYSYSVGEITEIRTELFCNIEYYSAASDTVTLEIQPNLHEYISVDESDGILTVTTTRNISWSGNAPVLTVGTPSLKALSLSGAGQFTAHDTITGDSFTLRMDGAGSGTAKLDVNSLTANMSGASNFELSGRADNASVTMSGAGAVNALQLDTRDASVSLAGVGTVRIGCSGILKINADGMGTVEYKGSPSIDINKGGFVNVKKVG